MAKGVKKFTKAAAKQRESVAFTKFKKTVRLRREGEDLPKRNAGILESKVRSRK